MTSFLLRAALTGLALWVVTLFVSGIRFVGGDTTVQRVGIIFVVAVIFVVIELVVVFVVIFVFVEVVSVINAFVLAVVAIAVLFVIVSF